MRDPTGFDLGSRHVGDGAPCLIVAEVAQAHEGSLGMAHAYVDAIATAGADVVKFQCHLAEHESTPDEPWREEPVWCQDASRYDYWRRMEFTPSQWDGLKRHANGVGLIFMASPFSAEAVHRLDPLVLGWKVASGELLNGPLRDAINATGKPAILSSGMSTWEEIDRAYAALAVPRIMLQCTSEYPCAPEHIGLWALSELRERYGCAMGLSDHSGTIYPSLAAVALGASVVEVHVALSREMWGLDVLSSVTPAELGQLVAGVRVIEAALQPLDKDTMAETLQPMREVFAEKWRRKAAEQVRDSSVVERWPHSPDAAGSIPAPATSHDA